MEPEAVILMLVVQCLVALELVALELVVLEQFAQCPKQEVKSCVVIWNFCPMLLWIVLISVTFRTCS